MELQKKTRTNLYAGQVFRDYLALRVQKAPARNPHQAEETAA